MGKRNKSCTSDEGFKTNQKKIKPSLFGETPENKLNTNKRNKKITHLNGPLEDNLIVEKNVDVDESEPIELSSCIKKVETSKENKTNQNNDGLNTDFTHTHSHFTAEVTEDSNLFASSPYNREKTKKKKNKSDEFRQNKKYIFTDGEPEVDNKTTKQRKIKNTELCQEVDVKDEDIDKFCDELTEEDNQDYENWIELIEAKLSSNKKKPI